MLGLIATLAVSIHACNAGIAPHTAIWLLTGPLNSVVFGALSYYNDYC